MPSLQTHASIDTNDLPASIRFYEALLGSKPTLVRRDYARFRVEEPPLVLGLNLVGDARATRTGPLRHLGVCFPGPATLDDARRRLERLGAALDHEEDTECCYARLERVWVTDPSGVSWELFTPHEEVVESDRRSGARGPCCETTCCEVNEA